MAAIQPYVLFPGTAREALERYAEIFGGEARLFTYEEFSRTDGPADAIAHGVITGPVPLAGADAAPGEASVRMDGMWLSLLGTAEPATLHSWFDALAEGGEVVDAMQERPWGATDGQVVDRFGMRWLVGYEPDAPVEDGASAVFANVGTLEARPGRRDEVVAILVDGSADLAAHGCLQYDVGVSDDAPDTVCVIERWRSAADQRASLELPAVRAAIARAMPLLTGVMGGHAFDVVGSPLDSGGASA